MQSAVVRAALAACALTLANGETYVDLWSRVP
jgi:hypothetical protein